MAPRLPKEFTNVPLGDLWQYIKIADELVNLAKDPQEIRYWVGWHDCMASLFSDLTFTPTIKLYQALADKFTDFRFEDQIEQMGEDLA